MTFTEACAWISSDTALALVPDYSDQNSRTVTLGVTLHRPGNLDEQAAAILKEQGIAGVSFTTNLALNEARLEQAEREAIPYYSLSLLVLLCGYLMIYGIVHVAAQQDILYYASLKSLGMTPRQIRILRGLCSRPSSGMVTGIFPACSHYRPDDHGNGRKSRAVFSFVVPLCRRGPLHAAHHTVVVPDSHDPALRHDAVRGRPFRRRAPVTLHP